MHGKKEIIAIQNREEMMVIFIELRNSLGSGYQWGFRNKSNTMSLLKKK